MKLEVTITKEDTVLRVGLAGDLDHYAARNAMTQIEEELERNLPRDCTLDLGNVPFMDSSGIALILKTNRYMNELGGRLWVQNVPRQPMRVLTAAGIDRLISVREQKQGGYYAHER